MAITCNCESGGKCEIHPKPHLIEKAVDKIVNVHTPKIDADDRFTLKCLEADWLKIRTSNDQMRQQAIQREENALHQLNQFIAAMHEKYDARQGEWALDLSKLREGGFVAREAKR
jgi:hypothetical protein